jgi:hypothetical protein
MIDYRELLKKYMNNVIQEEGAAYLPEDSDYSDVVFSKAESDELNAIADELRES